MKIDGRLYKEEITYCAKIASKLGYEEDVLREMILKIYSDPHITTDKESLKAKIQAYLKKIMRTLKKQWGRFLLISKLLSY